MNRTDLEFKASKLIMLSHCISVGMCENGAICGRPGRHIIITAISIVQLTSDTLSI